MSTARLTWLVLDRIVPPDEEASARVALIARNPEIQSLVNQGLRAAVFLGGFFCAFLLLIIAR